LPADCKETSTSLKIEQNQTFSRFNLLRQFITIWDKHYQGFLDGGYSYLRPFWLSNNITLGRVVNIMRNNEVISGEALDISEQGGLMVRLENGNVQEFLAEDVSLGRNFYAGNKKY
jgi:BirA family biotin operon repressor/biotin-[acetyl-CoA-carboxylase] ligase